MDRKEFWEWLATCPTHKKEEGVRWYETTDEFGYITVKFKVEDIEDEETEE